MAGLAFGKSIVIMDRISDVFTQMGTVFAEMSSWTALTSHIKTKNIKKTNFGNFIMKILNILRVIKEIAYQKKYRI